MNFFEFDQVLNEIARDNSQEALTQHLEELDRRAAAGDQNAIQQLRVLSQRNALARSYFNKWSQL